jgi:cold shock CspA family protein
MQPAVCAGDLFVKNADIVFFASAYGVFPFSKYELFTFVHSAQANQFMHLSQIPGVSFLKTGSRLSFQIKSSRKPFNLFFRNKKSSLTSQI